MTEKRTYQTYNRSYHNDKPKVDTERPFRNIPYPITILNHNGFGLNYKLPNKVLKSKKRRGVL